MDGKLSLKVLRLIHVQDWFELKTLIKLEEICIISSNRSWDVALIVHFVCEAAHY